MSMKILLSNNAIYIPERNEWYTTDRSSSYWVTGLTKYDLAYSSTGNSWQKAKVIPPGLAGTYDKLTVFRSKDFNKWEPVYTIESDFIYTVSGLCWNPSFGAAGTVSFVYESIGSNNTVSGIGTTWSTASHNPFLTEDPYKIIRHNGNLYGSRSFFTGNLLNPLGIFNGVSVCTSSGGSFIEFEPWRFTDIGATVDRDDLNAVLHLVSSGPNLVGVAQGFEQISPGVFYSFRVSLISTNNGLTWNRKYEPSLYPSGQAWRADSLAYGNSLFGFYSYNEFGVGGFKIHKSSNGFDWSDSTGPSLSSNDTPSAGMSFVNGNFYFATLVQGSELTGTLRIHKSPNLTNWQTSEIAIRDISKLYGGGFVQGNVSLNTGWKVGTL